MAVREKNDFCKIRFPSLILIQMDFQFLSFHQTLIHHILLSILPFIINIQNL